MRLYHCVYNHGDDCVSESCGDLGSSQRRRWGLNKLEAPPVALHSACCGTAMCFHGLGNVLPLGQRSTPFLIVNSIKRESRKL